MQIEKLDDRCAEKLIAAVSHPEHGVRLQLSTDGGATWEQLTGRPAYPSESDLTVRRIWQITPGAPSQPEAYYAGVDEAGLFISYDRGLT